MGTPIPSRLCAEAPASNLKFSQMERNQKIDQGTIE